MAADMAINACLRGRSRRACCAIQISDPDAKATKLLKEFSLDDLLATYGSLVASSGSVWASPVGWLVVDGRARSLMWTCRQ